MRTIRRTRAFKRNYRREKRGQYRRTLDQDLPRALELLSNDEALPEQYQDHPMRGDRARERNCHIRPDLVLIYRKPNATDLSVCRNPFALNLSGGDGFFQLSETGPFFETALAFIRAYHPVANQQGSHGSPQRAPKCILITGSKRKSCCHRDKQEKCVYCIAT